jgi:hypothetical protein
MLMVRLERLQHLRLRVKCQLPEEPRCVIENDQASRVMLFGDRQVGEEVGERLRTFRRPNVIMAPPTDLSPQGRHGALDVRDLLGCARTF